MAIVRDYYAGRAASRFLSLIVLVTMCSPLFAPSIGALVVSRWSWRETFLVLAGFGLVLLVTSTRSLPETLPKARRRGGGLSGGLKTMRALSRDPQFMGYALTAGFSSGTMLAYVAASSFVYQNIYGLTPQEFGVAFALIGVAVILTNQLNRLLLRFAAPLSLVRIGVAGSLAASAAMLLSVSSGGPSLAGFAVLTVLVFSFAQLLQPNAAALALTEYPESAGSASAIIGMLRFALGGVAAPLVGVAGSGTAGPMAGVMLGFAVISALVFVTLRPSVHRPIPTETILSMPP
jgi:DHA1 family bicyclomycin/chloramphenicol resistance-like MFS transporter